MAVSAFLAAVLFFLLLTSSSSARPLSPSETPPATSNRSVDNAGRVSPASPSPSPEQHPAPRRQRPSPYHPSMLLIVGLLTTVFSATFLLLLYAKHCKQSSSGGGYSYHGNAYPTLYPVVAGASAAAGRKNSGIDRAVIELLPVFRFQSLSGHKDGLECAVCLARFEPAEVLRLLPKCKHAFHVECVDTWLDARSTCPLCRYRVDPEDVLLVDRQAFSPPAQNHMVEIGEGAAAQPEVRRVSGRHSSPGERGRFLQFLQNKRQSFDQKMANLRRFDRSLIRKDGLLLSTNNRPPVANEQKRASAEERRRRQQGRLDHRIIVSAGDRQRWSNVEPPDLLYLRSEMIISNSGRMIGGGCGGLGSGRSASEITCLSRFQEYKR